MDVQKVCNEAADLIEEKGWCQGQYEDDGGRHCLLGAVSKADADLQSILRCPENEWKRRAIISALGGRLGWQERPEYVLTGWNALTTWNDDPKRTQEEVVALLRDKLPVPVVVEG